MRGWLLAALILTLTLSGCIGIQEINPFQAEPQPIDDETPEIPTDGPNVVIAVIDTGINVYHQEFHAPDRWDTHQAEPQTLTETPILQDTLQDIEPIPLTLDNDDWDATIEEDWDATIEEDWDTLMSLKKETLYTFPGTKVLGAISFIDQPDDWPLILDRPGHYTHGTMTASRAVGETVSIPADNPNIWLVKVQGFTTKALDWTAEQDWIDIVSISAGLSPLTTLPGAPNALDQGAIEAYQNLANEKPFFASSGNGVGNTATAGYPVWLRGASGAPDAISVGATDNDHMTQWHNQDPYIAADGCRNPAAPADTTHEIANNGGGTSSATPFSAGGAALMLLEARTLLDDDTVGPTLDMTRTMPEDAWDSQNPRDAQVILAQGEAPPSEGPLKDGVFTMRDFKNTLYRTALQTPIETESDGDHCPNSALPPEAIPKDSRFPFIGYGEVNAQSIQAAIDVLHGDSPLPDRPMDDWHYERAHASKQTFVNNNPTLPSAPPVPSS